MRSPLILFFIIAIVAAVDIYVFWSVRHLTNSFNASVKLGLGIVYWLLCLICLVSFLLFPYLTTPFFRQYMLSTSFGWLFAQLLLGAVLLVDDLRRGAFWTAGQIATRTGAQFINTENGIPRSTFLTWLGVGLASSLFMSFIYGFGNKYKYRVIKKKIAIKDLPDAFKGFKIVHISDIHSGSLQDKAAVQKGIDLILHQKADLVLFTGDLVNDKATEMKPWMDTFSQIKAPYGVYSTLGNHDYGDYVIWPSAQAKSANLEALKKVHGQLGWKLMMNENALIERNGQSIRLVGIENWGAKARFPKYGKMEQAMQGVQKDEVIILMSHDPSHWDAEVQIKYPEVNLMLSGHTHGMQFGIENPYFRFSPVQWVYKQWAGIYQQNNQQLYVNRGFGFLGYPGRVGILPEITLLELS